MAKTKKEQPDTKASDRPLLLEIGTEEIPARFLLPAISDLKDIAARVFEEYRLDYRNINAFATPRRLSLIAEGVSVTQRDMAKEVFGPSRKAAFDEQGSPTKAATGFAGSLGLEVKDLIVKMKGKAEYVAAVIEEKGQPAIKVLPDALQKIIFSLHFPKSMRWGNSAITFARPIHWILALFGTETVVFEIDGIKSSNLTKGHRFLSPAFFQVKEISFYMNLLENNFVILDHDKRKIAIRKGIADLLAKSEKHPVADEALLDTVNFLVEYPSPVLCSFSSDYLALPRELLVTVMKDHQKYFAVQDAAGNLTNNFIVISNSKPENAETIRVGAERVIKARFDDAKFYYREDTGKSLADRVEDLRQVTFHDKLGSLFEKTERVVSLAGFLSQKSAPSLHDKVLRAARLSKADLITGVVREFAELQGIMGKYYARHFREDEAVAAAIEEQYLPQHFGGRLPSTETGSLLSLADKTDTIASFFAIGSVPTGSEDPFALRRQAMGVISILLDRQYPVTLNEIFTAAVENLLDVSGIRAGTDTIKTVLSFMDQRTAFILSSLGHEADSVESVIPLSSVVPLTGITARLDALRQIRAEDYFPGFLLSVKRVNNIIPKRVLPSLRTELLALDAEKELYAAFTDLKKNSDPLFNEGNFLETLRTLSGLVAPVNAFFDKVMVMDKDEDIKMNRLSLLKEIWDTLSRLADFSKLS